MVDDEHARETPGPSMPFQSHHPHRPRLSLADEVALAVHALSKASRSFTLYDPHNDAVKMLIGDYREKSIPLSRNAPITLEVLPFEVVFDNQVVYEEHDRERSLAFRLFRDGVRTLRFEPGLGWDDLVSLLEVMSVRSTGVRQQEEDLITLLRKARFENITIESVEGYIPDEEVPENQEMAPLVDEESHGDPPHDWDQPLPGASGGKVRYEPIDPRTLEELLKEESGEGVTAQAVRAVFELLQTANTLKDTEMLEQIIPFVQEVQHFLIVERDLDELARLAGIYRDAFPDGRRLPVLDEDRSFERIMRMVTEDDVQVPVSVRHLLGAPTRDMASRALDMLAFGAGGARRKALLEVVGRAASQDASVVTERVGTAPPDLARDLFAILGKVAPNERIGVAFGLLQHPDALFQLELLDVVCETKGIQLAHGLQALMGSPHEQVRIAASEALARLGGAKAVPMLAEHARRRASEGMEPREAEAIGRAMARCSVDEALPVLRAWTQAGSGLRSLLSKIRKASPADRMLYVAAVEGLALCPEKEAKGLLQGVLSRSDDPDLADRCQRALDRLQEGQRHE